MSSFGARPIATVLLPLFVLHSTGCTTIRLVHPSEVKSRQPEPIEGVTTADGQAVRFDAPGRITTDSVYATVESFPFAIALDSVQALWVRRGSSAMRLRPEVYWRSAAERIIGVTTSAGSSIAFEEPGWIGPNGVEGTVGNAVRVIPLDSVQRVWVRRTDAGMTTIAVLGIAVAVGVGIAVAANASKGGGTVPQDDPPASCPFVYAWNGESFVFDAEPYGGAITRGLARNDISPLEHLRPDNGLYRILVNNELYETQQTDLLELWQVDHPAGSRVIADDSGQLYTLRQPLVPSSVVDQEGRDLFQWLRSTDRLIWESPPTLEDDGQSRDEIVMTFGKPTHATRATLVANVATGYWGSLTIKSILSLLGDGLEGWYAQLDARPSAVDSLLAGITREELYHLKIEVEEPTGWAVRGVLRGAGPFIAEDRAVSLDVSQVEGDSLRIRVRPPRGFWALNSFGVDYSKALAIRVDTLSPIEARDDRNTDIRGPLAAADGSYYTMPTTGDRAYVTFRATAPRAGMDRTVLLHSRGYYKLHIQPNGPPEMTTFKRLFEIPGAAWQFAADEYRSVRVAQQGGPYR